MSHAAIIENKRLGHALTLVKAQQHLKRTTKVITNIEKDGYKKRPRSTYGPDFDRKRTSPPRWKKWKSPKALSLFTLLDLFASVSRLLDSQAL